MKTKLIFACTGLSLVIILGQLGVLDNLLLLFLVGAIPGTNTNLSPIFMMVIFVTIAGLLTVRLNRYQRE